MVAAPNQVSDNVQPTSTYGSERVVGKCQNERILTKSVSFTMAGDSFLWARLARIIYRVRAHRVHACL